MINLLITGLLYLTTLFFNSENNGDVEPDKLYIEKALKSGYNVNLSRYARSIEYIPLETTNEAILGWIDLFDTDGENFYCATAYKSDNITVFDKNGKYIRSIGSKGRGPKEYKTLMNFSILESGRNSVEIGISGHTEFIVYERDNNYVRGFMFGEVKDGSNKISLGTAGFYENGNYLFLGDVFVSAAEGVKEILYILDDSRRVCNSLDMGKRATYKQNAVIPGLGSGNIDVASPSHIYFYNGSMRLFKGSADTLFFFDKKLNKAAGYIYDYGKYAADEDFRIGVNDILETDDFITLKYYTDLKRFPSILKPGVDVDNARVGLLVFDKKEYTFKALKYNNAFGVLGFVNDLDNGAPFTPQFVKNGKLYQFVDAIKFIDMAQKSNSAKMKAVAAKLTDDSNPVMVVVTLK